MIDPRAPDGVTARASVAFCALLLALTVGSLLQDASAQPTRAPDIRTQEAASQDTRGAVRATKHMVVAANPHASEAGLEILRAGGSAVDAAIAVQLVLSLVEPQSSGIGGGAFMLLFDAPPVPPAGRGEQSQRNAEASAAIIAYEGRETAPQAAAPDMFLDSEGTPASFGAVGAGGLAVGVPGVTRMLEMAHREHGRLPWARVFEPAIALAERGFAVSPRLHALLDGFKRFARGERFRALYYDANGEARAVGYRLVNKDYAATLRLLAAAGAEAMYTGDLAAAIVEEVRHNSVLAGRMTRDDLARYEAHKTPPLCTPYREWRVCGPQPPSSGGVTVQQILGMLHSFDLASARDDAVLSIHLFAEASRLAFADRSLYLADPAFVEVPVAGLLSPAYLEQRAALIDPARALTRVSAGRPPSVIAWDFAPAKLEDRVSTSHFSIIDQWGDAVSMTTSVQSAFGSQLMVGGFLLNNQLTDFDFEPEVRGARVANRPDSGKRPLSSMAPTVVMDRDGRLRIVIGSPGGTRIIDFVAQALLSMLDWGMDIQQAVAAPHIVARGDSLELEQGSPLLRHTDALSAKGHRVVERSLNSGLHGIAVDYTDAGPVLWGGADPRREGIALGD